MVLATLGPAAHSVVFPQYEFKESTGRIRRIDFAVVTEKTRLAIELDGFTYHAEGQVSRQAFSDGLQRQNELVLAGWRVIRFSWDQFQSAPADCRDTLRRAVIHDPKLHPSLRHETVEPHAIQQEALARLEQTRRTGQSRGLVVLATGLGKTFLAALDAKAMGGRVLFIVHSNAILEQARDAFRRIWPDVPMGLYNSYEKQPDAHVLFANVATLRAGTNLERFRRDEFSYIIIDEFHHGATAHYRRILDYFTPRFMLGLTATPNRTDRKSILALLGGNLVYEVTQQEAISRGFLVPFRYYALKDNVDYSRIKHNGFRYDLQDLNKALIIKRRDDAIISKYREICAEGKAIGFCVSIEHAERAAAHFVEAGIPATAIHSGMTHHERRKLTDDFRADRYKVAFVRDIFNEGIDFPDVHALLFMRPTESKIIFTQQLGRGLRVNPGKDGVTVLDFIGNYVSADKVIDYLSSYGGAVSLGGLMQKPVFHYDNGNEIHFERSALDTISVLNPTAISDLDLVSDFSTLYSLLGHMPTIPEIQQRGRFKVHHYVERYGSWGAFVERLRRLYPEDFEAGAAGIGPMNDADLEEYVDALDEDMDFFVQLLQESAAEAAQVRATYERMDGRRKPGVSSIGHLSPLVQALARHLESLEEKLREITLCLCFRFPPGVVKTPKDTEGRTSLPPGPARALADLTGMREPHLLERQVARLDAQQPLFATQVALVGQAGSSDVETLAKLYERALELSGVTRSARTEAQAVVRRLSEL